MLIFTRLMNHVILCEKLYGPLRAAWIALKIKSRVCLGHACSILHSPDISHASISDAATPTKFSNPRATVFAA